MAFAESLFAACHIFHGKLPLSKDLIQALQNGTNTHWFHTLWHRNKYFMYAGSQRFPSSLEGIIVNCSHYSTWIITIAPHLALPHKPKWLCSAYLLDTSQQKSLWSVAYSVLLLLKHSRSWGAYFIHHRNNATRSLCFNSTITTPYHSVELELGVYNLVCV